MNNIKRGIKDIIEDLKLSYPSLAYGNDNFKQLSSIVEQGPAFYPGQRVLFRIVASTPAGPIAAWKEFTIVGVHMIGGNNAVEWLYSLSTDPPGPCHYGRTQFTGIPENQLYTEIPGIEEQDESA